VSQDDVIRAIREDLGRKIADRAHGCQAKVLDVPGVVAGQPCGAPVSAGDRCADHAEPRRMVTITITAPMADEEYTARMVAELRRVIEAPTAAPTPPREPTPTEVRRAERLAVSGPLALEANLVHAHVARRRLEEHRDDVAAAREEPGSRLRGLALGLAAGALIASAWGLVGGAFAAAFGGTAWVGEWLARRLW